MAHKFLNVKKLKKEDLTRSDYDKCKARVESLNPRKNAIWLIEIVVTFDIIMMNKITEKRRSEFFTECCKFFITRYGRENFISASGHKADGYPYMHYRFIPKTSDGRLSAKDIVTRAELINLHKDFDAEIGEKWGLQRIKDLEAELEKLSMEQLNVMILGYTQEEAEKMSVKIGKLKGNIGDLENQLEAERGNTENSLSEAHIRLKKINSEVEELESRKNDLKRQISDFEKKIENLRIQYYLIDNLSKSVKKKR